ncbi:MAG TPA: leucyl aminopeptidase [Rickettsiales bacterium]|nr:leucyl aminopeptidase [Rickettsiales bacterium]
MITVSFAEHTTDKENAKVKSSFDTLVALVGDGGKLLPAAAALDKMTGGAVKTAVAAGKFTGKKGQTLSIVAPHGLSVQRLVLLGIGKEKEFDLLAAQSAGGKLTGHLNSAGVKKARLIVDAITGVKISADSIAANIAYGAKLRAYSFDKYHTTKKAEEKPTLAAIEVVVKDAKSAGKQFDVFEKIVAGVFFTRDLVSEPANVIYPESLAERCKELTALGVTVEVLSAAMMKKLGMGSLLGVAQGSVREAKLVVMQWKGGSKSDAPLAFVGKGVTFDTGGISIKPAGNMWDMKYDMAGAGAVIGLIKALAGRKAKVNAVGVVGLVENMPDGNAQRPGDVVTSMSGQTIEVLNTDAEGRLVLADALWYTQERFNPAFVIDLATLTGAIVVALGTSRAGLFSNNDKLADQLFASGKKAGEEVWRLPLADVYDKQINSDIADMQNIGKDREAGSITAAQFLQRFIKDKKTPWVHLDIAGMAWAHGDLDVTPKGATGYGIRLLNQLVADYYE